MQFQNKREYKRCDLRCAEFFLLCDGVIKKPLFVRRPFAGTAIN